MPYGIHTSWAPACVQQERSALLCILLHLNNLSTIQEDDDHMIYPETDELNQYPRYILTLLAAERARLLREGAKPLVPVNGIDFNPLTVALQEIAAGKIKPRIIDDRTVEVIIQGSEHTWQVARDLKQLSQQAEDEEEEATRELMEFYQQETALRDYAENE
jgi:DNA-directed RNA polymerase omega subunit